MANTTHPYTHMQYICIANTTLMSYAYSILEMSFSNGFPENIDSKSTSCVIIHGVELSDTLIFINSYDTQKPRMQFFIQILLHLAHNFLEYPHKLSTMKIGLQMSIGSTFNDFSFFFDLTQFVSISTFGQFQNDLFRIIT